MKRRRTPDVINVNQEWNVHSGTRMYGQWVGRVLGHDYRAAHRAASARWPDMSVFWIEEKAVDDARIERELAGSIPRGRSAAASRLPPDAPS